MPGEQTEKPTPQRLKKAREEGQFLSSRGALSAVQFLVFVSLIGSLMPAWTTHLSRALVRLYQTSLTGEITQVAFENLMRDLFLETLTPLLTLGAALFGATLAAQLAVTRLGFTLNKLMPDFSRLNPLPRLKSLPSQNLKAVAEALVLVVALGLFLQSFITSHAEMLLRLPLQTARAAASQIGDAVDSLLWKAAALFILFGAFDLYHNYQRHMKGLKMSKQDIKQEHKHNDGDPHVKQRIRRLRRELLRRKMMQQVPQATAVIVNPTHFAVAIRFDSETMASPIVVAKGKNWLALRIRQVAIESQVPIVENPPLARALYGALDVGSAISPEFYKAIAEILAYVYRLMGRKLP